MFQIKSFTSIVASIINRMRASTSLITDYNVGSISRTLIEGPAQEIDELYQQMVRGLVEAIAASTYASFNFPLLAATSANGSISIIISAQTSAVVIGAGSTLTPTAGAVTYTTQSDVMIPIGDTVGTVIVVASTAGSSGNLAAGAQFTVSPSPAGFLSATNVSAIQNGTDQATDAQRKVRFQQYISTLARGTVAAIKYGLSTVQLTDANGNITERVGSSQVVEPYKTDPTQPVGLVNSYIHNGVGNTSAALVAQAQAVINGYYNAAGKPIPGYKAAGVAAPVAAATEEPIYVLGIATILPGFDGPTAVAAIQSAFSSYILSVPTGAAVRFSKLEALAQAVAGVDYFTMVTPVADVGGGTGIKLMPGTLNITWASSLAAQFSMSIATTSSLTPTPSGSW